MTEAARSRVHPPRALPGRTKCTVPKFSGRQRLWAAMRVLKEFDLPTLCMAADAGEKGAREFLGCLGRVGYVSCTSGQNPQSDTWRLIRNTGPKHPIIRRSNAGSVSIIECDDRNDGRIWRDEIDFRRPGSGKPALENGGVS